MCGCNLLVLSLWGSSCPAELQQMYARPVSVIYSLFAEQGILWALSTLQMHGWDGILVWKEVFNGLTSGLADKTD